MLAFSYHRCRFVSVSSLSTYKICQLSYLLCQNHFSLNSNTTSSHHRCHYRSVDLSLPHLWYDHARKIKRNIICHIGPTNSGKTYNALKRLKECRNGLYLGPLRLLAWEICENLRSSNIKCNLLTGQERDFYEGDSGTHLSSTIEMADFHKSYEVAVIDEVQLIGSQDRGWAWTEAFLGLACKELHVCGSSTAIPILTQLVQLTGDSMEVVHYERLSPMTVETEALNSYHNMQRGDCVVGFNRKLLYEVKRSIERKNPHLKCCVIYGGLPQEARKQQARLFDDKHSGFDILVASDAIGMGLNLSIKRIIFSTIEKFDGFSKRTLLSSEVKQIAGRTGRFGSQYNEGTVTCLHSADIILLKSLLKMKDRDIKRAGLFPNIDQLKLLSASIRYSIDEDLLTAFWSYFITQKWRDNSFVDYVRGTTVEDHMRDVDMESLNTVTTFTTTTTTTTTTTNNNNNSSNNNNNNNNNNATVTTSNIAATGVSSNTDAPTESEDYDDYDSDNDDYDKFAHNRYDNRKKKKKTTKQQSSPTLNNSNKSNARHSYYDYHQSLTLITTDQHGDECTHVSDILKNNEKVIELLVSEGLKYSIIKRYFGTVHHFVEQFDSFMNSLRSSSSSNNSNSNDNDDNTSSSSSGYMESNEFYDVDDDADDDNNHHRNNRNNKKQNKKSMIANKKSRQQNNASKQLLIQRSLSIKNYALSNSLFYLLDTCRQYAELDPSGLYFLCNIDSTLLLAKILDEESDEAVRSGKSNRYAMSLEHKYIWSMTPLSVDNDFQLNWFRNLVRAFTTRRTDWSNDSDSGSSSGGEYHQQYDYVDDQVAEGDSSVTTINNRDTSADTFSGKLVKKLSKKQKQKHEDLLSLIPRISSSTSSDDTSHATLPLPPRTGIVKLNLTFDYTANYQPNTPGAIQILESYHQTFEIYLWLHLRFPLNFPDQKKALKQKDLCTKLINVGLKSLNLTPKKVNLREQEKKNKQNNIEDDMSSDNAINCNNNNNNSSVRKHEDQANISASSSVVVTSSETAV